jgi:membrane-associated protein
MNSFDWKNLIDPFFYIHFDVNGGNGDLYCVIYHFAETGLFAFLLPGDSLPFLAKEFIMELIEKCVFYVNRLKYSNI